MQIVDMQVQGMAEKNVPLRDERSDLEGASARPEATGSTEPTEPASAPVPRAIRVGLDIGSTTTKVVVLDADTHEVVA